MKITTPEIICDVFSFLHKDQIERTQLVNKFWNNVTICHKNILPLRLFEDLYFSYDGFYLYKTNQEEHCSQYLFSCVFDGTNLSKGYVSPRYSQLTIDELLKNLNDVVFNFILIPYYASEDMDNLLNLMKLVTTKIGGRFRGKFGKYDQGRFDSKLNEIFGKGFLNTARYKIHSN